MDGFPETLDYQLCGDVIRFIVAMVPPCSPATNEDLRQAVTLWFDDNDTARRRYGHISLWDTRHISDMSSLFANRKTFNEPLYWDTAGVTDMSRVFLNCHAFNQPINWDTRQVTDLHQMFAGCIRFNCLVTLTDTSRVVDMSCMFCGCWRFNQDVELNISNAVNLNYLFYNCYSLCSHRVQFVSVDSKKLVDFKIGLGLIEANDMYGNDVKSCLLIVLSVFVLVVRLLVWYAFDW